MRTIKLLMCVLVIGFSFHSFAEEPASEKPAAAATAPAPTVGKDGKRDASTKTYTGEAQNLKLQLIQLFEASEKVNSPAEKAAARGTIESAVDWDRIAKTCLGAQGKNQSAANREQFQKLLRGVILKTAFSRMDSFWDGTTYRFDKIDVKGKEASVKAKFKVKEDTIALDYFMGKKGDKWMMYDIVVDDLRYSEVINEKVTAFLKEGKFAGLLDSLKKRLEELQKDTADNKKP